MALSKSTAFDGSYLIDTSRDYKDSDEFICLKKGEGLGVYADIHSAKNAPNLITLRASGLNRVSRSDVRPLPAQPSVKGGRSIVFKKEFVWPTTDSETGVQYMDAEKVIITYEAGNGVINRRADAAALGAGQAIIETLCGLLGCELTADALNDDTYHLTIKNTKLIDNMLYGNADYDNKFV